MKIYSMTATFGKLEQQTLTLKPGLNIIEAPNEWGKSTWCAFLVAMLYGIDTRAKTTKTTLADKTHYAPWSGAPMEGRMDICWNGRDITIERRTKGRLIFGDFRAYETATGLDVPELTAANCGMELLGVEQGVFTRAGFIRMNDLPVTQDDALRRRLNALVTTGDESGAGDKLAQKLKDLKNKCRFNRTGLLPQAEEQAQTLEQRLRERQELDTQTQRLRERQQELEQRVAQLQNHKIALAYQQAQEESKYIRQAEMQLEEQTAQLRQLENQCAGLPTEENTERARGKLQRLQNEAMSLQMEQQMLPGTPERPTCPKYYEGLSGLEAVDRTRADVQVFEKAKEKKESGRILRIAGIAALLLCVLSLAMRVFVSLISTAVAIPAAVAGVILVCLGIARRNGAEKQMAALTEKYATSPEMWEENAQQYARQMEEYETRLSQYQESARELEQRRMKLAQQMETLTDGKDLAQCLQQWDGVCEQWRKLREMRRDHQNLQAQVAALKSMSKEVCAPQLPDELTYDRSETDAQLQSAAYEQKQNQLRLGQILGQAERLGGEDNLRKQLRQVRSRIEELEDTYLALELAQKALSTATAELQRRFAPRITKRAQELFAKFTDGRYEKLMLGEDMSVEARTGQESTMRSSLWRSDGTVDQLYLALRLAVAEELTPEAPLVLDDAMVRFDDVRLEKALHILSEAAENKQVILFTCQRREKKLQGEIQ